MPDSNQGGILSRLGDFFGGIGGAMNPAIQENNFRRQAYDALAQQNGPGNAALLMANLQAYQMNYQQQVMQQTAQALIAKGYKPQDAYILASHPEMLNEQGKPTAVPLGGSIFSPLSFGGGQQSFSQGQQPGEQSPQQPQGGIVFQNSNGMPGQDQIESMAQRYLMGDKEAIPPSRGGGPGVMNYNAAMARVAQLQKEQGISDADILQRQAKYPAFKKAVDKLQGQQASMGQAGMEFQQLFPQFMADLQKYGATQYPDANKFFQFLSAHAGDPNVAPLRQRMLTLANVYGRAVSANPASANTDFKQREFGEALNQYWPLAATGKIGDAMMQEIQTAHDSVPKEINRMAVDSGLGKKPDPETMTAAKAALAKGAKRDAIARRLAEQGFTADGL